MTEILCRKLYGKLVPIDMDNLNRLDTLPANTIVRAKLTKPRPLNSDEITDEQRSVAQNRLMWCWLTDMERTSVNEMAGTRKEEWHIKMKRKFLVQIYERDCQEYAETIAAIRNVYAQGLKDEFEKMINFIADKTSTTDGTVKQISEYLGCIERYCHGCGISLRTDTAMYELAGVIND